MKINPTLNSFGFASHRSAVFRNGRFTAQIRAKANVRRSIQAGRLYFPKMQTILYNAPSFPFLSLSLLFARSPIFFFLSGKNFSIFATLPPGCPAYRYSISSGIERPKYGLVTVRGETTRGGWKKSERSPRHPAERCDETVVYLYRRPYFRHRHYIGLSSRHPGCNATSFLGCYICRRQQSLSDRNASRRVASTIGPAARNA